jgi:hypothetical protein
MRILPKITKKFCMNKTFNLSGGACLQFYFKLEFRISLLLVKVKKQRGTRTMPQKALQVEKIAEEIVGELVWRRREE